MPFRTTGIRDCHSSFKHRIKINRYESRASKIPLKHRELHEKGPLIHTYNVLNPRNREKNCTAISDLIKHSRKLYGKQMDISERINTITLIKTIIIILEFVKCISYMDASSLSGTKKSTFFSCTGRCIALDDGDLSSFGVESS